MSCHFAIIDQRIMRVLFFLVCTIGICQARQLRNSEIDEKSWTGEAWKTLCKQAGYGKTNVEIATEIVDELTIENYRTSRFSVYVNDENCE
jgi:hypothetical protein